jgi:hypothetical protein
MIKFHPLLLCTLLLCSIFSFAQDAFPKIEYGKDNLQIYRDSLGKQVGEAYNRADFFFDGIAVVTKIKGEDQLMAALNKQGKYIVPFGIHYLRNLLNGLLLVTDPSGKSELYDRQGKLLYTCTGCEIALEQELPLIIAKPVPYESGQKKDNKISVLNLAGKQLFSVEGISCETIDHMVQISQYQYSNHKMPFFMIGKIVDNSSLIYNVYDTNGKMLLDSISYLVFIDGLAAVNKNSRTTVIDTNFNVLIPSHSGYQWGKVLQAHPQHGIAVKKQNKYGVVNTKNEIVVPFVWDWPIEFRGNEQEYSIYNANGDSVFLLNLNLDVIASPEIQAIAKDGKISLEGPIISKKIGSTYNKYGYRGADGKMKIPFQYSYLSFPQHDSLIFFKGDTAGFISTSGKRLFIFPVPCYGASWFGDGTAWYVRDRDTIAEQKLGWNLQLSLRLGAVDAKGKLVGNELYSTIAPFVEGRALVTKGEDWFFVDSLFRRQKFQTKYDFVTYYNNDIAIITDGKKYGLANRSGKIIAPLEYESMATEQKVNWYESGLTPPEPSSFTDRYGASLFAPGVIVVPAIAEGKIEATKSGNKFLLEVSTVDGKMADEISDTLNQWYVINPIFNRKNDIYDYPAEGEMTPIQDPNFTLLPFYKDGGYTLLDKNTGKPLSALAFSEVIEVNRYGAIVKTDTLYSFIDNTGKVKLSGYSKIAWDSDLLMAYKIGAFASSLPSNYQVCLKAEYYDVKGQKKFETLFHDHAKFLNDTIAYFRFGRTLSIIGKSGKRYLTERLLSEQPFIAICNNLLVYAKQENKDASWRIYDAKKAEQYRIPLLRENMGIGPYKINDTLFGYYNREAVKCFMNKKGQELPYYLEPNQMQEDEEWGTYFAQDQFIVRNKLNMRYGILSKNGKFLVPCIYKGLGNFVNGFALCTDSTEAMRVMNKLGKVYPWQISAEDLEMTGYIGGDYVSSDGWVIQRLAEPMEQRDHAYAEGEERTPPSYCFIDTSGKIVVQLKPNYALVGNFNEGLAPVLNTEGLLGFIDKTGKEIIPCKLPFHFDLGIQLPKFKAGYAYIAQYKGYIDRNGKQYFSISEEEMNKTRR